MPKVVLRAALRFQSAVPTGRSCTCRAIAIGGTLAFLAYLEQLASDARTLEGWSGVLIGDMPQPRGGPTIIGHVSHQIGLDAHLAHACLWAADKPAGPFLQ